MTGFSCPPPLMPAPVVSTEAPIRNDGWFPDIDPAELRAFAEDVLGDLRGHLLAFQPVPQLRIPVAAKKEKIGMEGLPLLDRDAVHEEVFPLADAVLLPADGDDRVGVLFGH